MEIKQLHNWNLEPRQAILLQQMLARQVQIASFSGSISTVAGADISYSKKDNLLFAAVVVLNFQTLKIIETATHVSPPIFPYVPGLLAFREIPPLLEAFKKLKSMPDVVMCDGQGIAHPRGLGLAAHLGLWLGIPTLGCAKSRLVGEFAEPRILGECSPLVYKQQPIGVVLCSKKRCKPLFISPGHLMDIEGSLAIVKKSLGRYRLPEPTRQAHVLGNRLRIKSALSGQSIRGLS